MEQQSVDKDYLEYRKKRVKRIKRFLLISLTVLLILPNVLCIYLLIQVNHTNRILEETQENLWELSVQLEDANAAAAVEMAMIPMQVEDEMLQEVIPDSLLYEGKERVYLTFDDGPSEYTDEILDILDEYEVKATFFVLAKDGYEEQYQRIVDEGHTLALHSYTHQYGQIYESPEAFRQDITMLSDYLFDITGYRCEFYRFREEVPIQSYSLIKMNVLMCWKKRVWCILTGMSPVRMPVLIAFRRKALLTMY